MNLIQIAATSRQVALPTAPRGLLHYKPSHSWLGLVDMSTVLEGYFLVRVS